MAAKELSSTFNYTIDTYEYLNTGIIYPKGEGKDVPIDGKNTDYITYSKDYITSVTGVEVIGAQIPLKYNTVNEFNNRLDIIDGKTPYSIIITPGNYTGVTLATELATKLNSVSSNWIVTYDENAYKFNFSRTSGVFTLVLTTSTCTKLLGLPKIGSVIDAGAYRSPGYAAPYGYSYMYVMSDTLIGFKQHKPLINGIPSTVLAKIPLNIVDGKVIYKPTIINHIIFPKRPVMKSFDIRLTDPDGNIVDLYGSPWSLSLLFYK
jgi:hypothetical protein